MNNHNSFGLFLNHARSTSEVRPGAVTLDIRDNGVSSKHLVLLKCIVGS